MRSELPSCRTHDQTILGEMSPGDINLVSPDDFLKFTKCSAAIDPSVSAAEALNIGVRYGKAGDRCSTKGIQCNPHENLTCVSTIKGSDLGNCTDRTNADSPIKCKGRCDTSTGSDPCPSGMTCMVDPSLGDGSDFDSRCRYNHSIGGSCETSADCHDMLVCDKDPGATSGTCRLPGKHPVPQKFPATSASRVI